MRLSETVVAEVHVDGEVILYDRAYFDEEDAASMLSLWGPMDYRNFFLVKVEARAVE